MSRAWVAVISGIALGILVALFGGFVLASLMGNVSGEPVKDLMAGMDDFIPGQPSVNLYAHGCRSYYEPPKDYGFIVTCTALESVYFKSATAIASYDTGLIEQVTLYPRENVTLGDVMLYFPGVHRAKKRSKPQAVSIWAYGSAFSGRLRQSAS